MRETLKEIVKERLDYALEKHLKQNEEYIKSRERYHKLFGQLKERLSESQEDRDFLMEFDKLTGEYGRGYEESVYLLGFHDGFEVGLEHGKYKEL